MQSSLRNEATFTQGYFDTAYGEEVFTANLFEEYVRTFRYQIFEMTLSFA